MRYHSAHSAPTISSIRASSISESTLIMVRADFLHKAGDEGLGVAEEHECLIHVIELVIDSGEARAHAAFDDHDGARFISIQNWHARNGAGGIVLRRGVHD